MDVDIEVWGELIKRPENDNDYLATQIGDSEGDEKRIGQTEASLRRAVPLKHRENCPHGWSSCILAFHRDGADFSLNGLVPSDLEALGEMLIDYAHRLRNY